MLDHSPSHPNPVTYNGHPSGYRVPYRRGPSWLTMIGVWTLVFLMVWTFVRPEQPSPLHDPNAQPRPVVPRGEEDNQRLVSAQIGRGIPHTGIPFLIVNVVDGRGTSTPAVVG